MKHLFLLITTICLLSLSALAQGGMQPGPGILYAVSGGGGDAVTLGTLSSALEFGDDTTSINIGSFDADGADALLVAIAMSYCDATGSTPSGVTYNGDAMTLVSSIFNGSAGATSLWYIAAPDAGTNAIVISIGDGGSLYGHAVAIPVIDVNTGDPYRTAATAAGGISSTVASTSYTSATDELWIGIATSDKANGATSITPDTGTEVFNHAMSGSGVGSSIMSVVTQPGATTVGAITWTVASATYRSALWFSLKP